ncbi:hypothetical protein AAY473_008659 [Plecturocebus cupreus]
MERAFARLSVAAPPTFSLEYLLLRGGGLVPLFPGLGHHSGPTFSEPVTPRAAARAHFEGDFQVQSSRCSLLVASRPVRHFRRPRWTDHLRSGVQDQPGQHDFFLNGNLTAKEAPIDLFNLHALNSEEVKTQSRLSPRLECNGTISAHSIELKKRFHYLKKHFGRLRQVDHLRSGVHDQPGQRGMAVISVRHAGNSHLNWELGPYDFRYFYLNVGYVPAQNMVPALKDPYLTPPRAAWTPRSTGEEAHRDPSTRRLLRRSRVLALWGRDRVARKACRVLGIGRALYSSSHREAVSKTGSRRWVKRKRF